MTLGDDMKTLENLIDEREALESQIAGRRQRAVDLAAELAGLIDDLLVADESDRPTLVQERAGLVAERDALADEIDELERRRDVAYLSYYELAEALAKDTYDQVNAAWREVKTAFEMALGQQRRFLNVGGGFSPDRDKRRIELAELTASLKAKIQIANRERLQARRAYEAAQARTEEARTHVLQSANGGLVLVRE